MRSLPSILAMTLACAAAAGLHAQNVPAASSQQPLQSGADLPGEARPPRVIRISSAVAQGQRIRSVPPVYPVEAKLAHIEGTVVMTMNVGTDGVPQDVTAISGPAELRQPAVDAVRQWRYKTYLLNGNPVEAQTQVFVNFRLSR